MDRKIFLVISVPTLLPATMKRYLARAEELRAASSQATDKHTCDALLRAAAAYEEMVWWNPYNFEEQRKTA
jgi:hypothetical protein